MIYFVDQRRGAIIAMDSLDDGVAFRQVVVNPMTVGPLRMPGAIASSGDGRLFLADRGNDRIVIFDLASSANEVLSMAVGTSGLLRQPSGVAAMPNGALLIADTGNRRIVFLESSGTANWSAFGSAGATASGGFEAPTSVCADSTGRILVADPGADRLVRFAGPDGFGFEEIALPLGARPSRPYAIAAGPGDGLLITDLVNARVLLLDQNDTITVMIDGLSDRSLIAPVSAAMSGNDVLIADAAAGCLTQWRFDAGSASWKLAQRRDGRGGPAGGPAFSSLSGLTTVEQL